MLIKRFILFSQILLLFIGFQNCSDVQFGNSHQGQIEGLGVSIDSIKDENDTSPNSITGKEPPNSTPGIFNQIPSEVPPFVTERTFPEWDEWASIAFEDNILDPKAGDRDYNDAVFNFQVKEHFNEKNELDHITLRAKTKSLVSAMDHKLYLFLNGNPTLYFDNVSTKSQKSFEGTAHIQVTDSYGHITNYQKEEAILLVSSAKSSVGQQIKVEILIDDPSANRGEDRGTIDFTRYRFVMQNYGQNRVGIDIAEVNKEDSMLSDDGYPFGFMIPIDWLPPNEGQLIDLRYPNFKVYRDWLSSGRSSLTDAERLWYE